MKDLVIDYPFRTIRLNLTDKEPLPIEAEGLELYQLLHLQLWDLKQCMLEFREKLEPLRVLANKLSVAYDNMENELHKYGRVAGFSDEMSEKFDPEHKGYTVKVNDLQRIIEEYADIVEEYNAMNVELEKDFAEGEELMEKFDETFREFDNNYISPIFKAYDTVQIDICSLDDDFDNFRSFCQEPDELRDKNIDEWDLIKEAASAVDKKTKVLNPHIKCVSDTLFIRKPSERDELN